MTDERTAINLRVDTGKPGENVLFVHVSPDYADSLAEAFGSVEDTTIDRDILEMSIPETATTVMEVIGPILAGGGVLAKVLHEWWNRNDGKKQTFEFNGERFSFEGMSAKEVGERMDQLREERNARWREQFPGQFPPDGNDS